jgi:hypothetical protein
MFRIICAVTAASLVVGICILAAEPSRTVEAGTQPAMMPDRLDIGQAGSDCSLHGWPYYQRECLRDRRHPAGQPPAMRLVATDRLIGATAQPAHQPSSRDKAERPSFTKLKPKSGRKATRGGRPYRDSGSSYAKGYRTGDAKVGEGETTARSLDGTRFGRRGT